MDWEIWRSNVSLKLVSQFINNILIFSSGALDWISVSMNAVVFILATLGNILVITTLLNKKMSTVTNYFLFSLAASDLMVALFCIPITTVGRLKAEFIFGEPMCKIFGYLMSEYATQFFLVGRLHVFERASFHPTVVENRTIRFSICPHECAPPKGREFL